nr:hypothetical protein CFP56_21880 [Quercus suber]
MRAAPQRRVSPGTQPAAAVGSALLPLCLPCRLTSQSIRTDQDVMLRSLGGLLEHIAGTAGFTSFLAR